MPPTVVIEAGLSLGSGWPADIPSPSLGSTTLAALGAFSSLLPPAGVPPYADGLVWRVQSTALLEQLLLALHPGFAFVGRSGGASRAELGFGASGTVGALLGSRSVGGGAWRTRVRLRVHCSFALHAGSDAPECWLTPAMLRGELELDHAADGAALALRRFELRVPASPRLNAGLEWCARGDKAPLVHIGHLGACGLRAVPRPPPSEEAGGPPLLRRAAEKRRSVTAAEKRKSVTAAEKRSAVGGEGGSLSSVQQEGVGVGVGVGVGSCDCGCDGDAVTTAETKAADDLVSSVFYDFPLHRPLVLGGGPLVLGGGKEELWSGTGDDRVAEAGRSSPLRLDPALLAEARRGEGRPLHVVVLWGPLMDQSC